MVPEATVFVIGHDDHRGWPIRTRLNFRDDFGDVPVTRNDVRVAGMLIQIALRFVERHRGQRAVSNIFKKRLAILQMLRARRLAGRIVREIVEGLMVRLKIWCAIRLVIDHLSVLRRQVRIAQRGIPGAGIPGPTDLGVA